MTDHDGSLREHLRKLLDWEDAHVGFDNAVKDVPPALRGTVPEGSAHSLWQLLEHLRICQLDILDFCRNPGYVEMPMEAYWPKSAAPPSAAAWDESVAAFRRDRAELRSARRRPRAGPLRADPPRLGTDVPAGADPGGGPQRLPRRPARGAPAPARYLVGLEP